MCVKLSVNSVIVHFSMDIKQHIGIDKYKDCPHNQVVMLLYKIKWSVLWSVYWIKKTMILINYLKKVTLAETLQAIKVDNNNY